LSFGFGLTLGIFKFDILQIRPFRGAIPILSLNYKLGPLRAQIAD